MCGNHAHDGTPIGHQHGPQPSGTRRPSRRAFLGTVGKGTLAAAIITPAWLAGCASDGSTAAPATTGAATDTTAGSVSTTGSTAAPTSAPPETTTSAPPETTAGGGDETLQWARTDLGFVSAYVLARGNTAAIVDTGVPDSAVAIGETLATLGLTYADVGHVILTHNHQDHAGSIGEVLEQAINATAYAGEADLGGINADIDGLVGGEDIFGFEMVPTPGHTVGHMAAFDQEAGLLLAGDAIFSESGAAIEGPAQFFNDVSQSRQSIAALAALTFNTMLPGHGDPLETDASSAVAALAATF